MMLLDEDEDSAKRCPSRAILDLVLVRLSAGSTTPRKVSPIRMHCDEEEEKAAELAELINLTTRRQNESFSLLYRLSSSE